MNMWCDGCGRHGNEEDMIEVGSECVMDDCTGTIHVDVEWLDRDDLEGLDEFDLLRVANDVREQFSEFRHKAAKPATPIINAKDMRAAACAALADVAERIVEEPFPLDGICTHCGCEENFEVTETGYDRNTSIELEFADLDDDGELPQTYTMATGSTNGWSDFSENGDIEVCCCSECGHIYALPEVFEWN